jgi:hypothetical protein
MRRLKSRQVLRNLNNKRGKNMRKEIYYGLSVFLILAAIGTAAAVNNGSGAAATNIIGYGAGFVDVNGDGICDNLVDSDGDGINDNCPMHRGAYMGQGSRFVDANGDGICDLIGSGRGYGGARNRVNQ